MMPAKILAKIETGRSRIQTQIFLRPKLLVMNFQGAQTAAPGLSFCFWSNLRPGFLTVFLCSSLDPGLLVRPNDGGQDWKVCTYLVLLVNSSVKF